MKILIIGGTGTISSAVSRLIAESGHDLWLLNRGWRSEDMPSGVHHIAAGESQTRAMNDFKF